MKVDVILPVYKGERWVSEAIESLLAQTYTNWHLTIVDDASPDETVQQVKPFCTAYPERMTLIRLSQNLRAAGARMEAIGQTDGDMIAFLDQDDRWLPQKLQKQIEYLSTYTTTQAVHTNVVHIDTEGNFLVGAADKENAYRASIPYERLSNEELSSSLLMGNSIRLVSVLLLREAFEAIGGFNTTLFGGEDWEFWVRFASKYGIGHLAEPLVERRIHTQNTSAYFRRSRSLGLLAALDIIEKTYPHLAPLANNRRANLLRKLLMAELKENRYSEARRTAWLLIQLRPLEVKPWLYLGLSSAGRYGNRLLKKYRTFYYS